MSVAEKVLEGKKARKVPTWRWHKECVAGWGDAGAAVNPGIKNAALTVGSGGVVSES